MIACFFRKVLGFLLLGIGIPLALMVLFAVAAGFATGDTPDGYWGVIGFTALIDVLMIWGGHRLWYGTRVSKAPETNQATPAEQAGVIGPPPVPSGTLADAVQVRDYLLSINGDDKPFRIIDGKEHGVDLVAEWKLADAKWYTFFGKASTKQVFRILMKLDPLRREVRAKDQRGSVDWVAGVPRASYSMSRFSGQMWSWEKRIEFGIREDFTPGVIYEYSFNTNTIKKPIKDAITACGWTYKPLVFARL